MRRPSIAIAGRFLLIAMLLANASPTRASEESEWHTVVGLISLGAGRMEAALSEFEQAVEADENDMEALYQRGVARAKLARWDEAAADLQKVVELEPTSSKALLDLGATLFQLDRLDEALPVLDKALGFEETAAQAHFYTGLCMLRRSEYGAASEHLETAISLDESLSLTARYYLGVIAHERYRFGKARDHFEYVRDEQPDSEVGLRSVGYIESIEEALDSRRNAYASVAFQYDSNVGLLNDVIDDAHTGRADERSTFQAGASAVAWESEQARVAVGYDFFQSFHFDLNEFDLQNHHVWADVVHERSMFTLGLGGSWDYYLLDNSKFLHEFNVSPSLVIHEGGLARTVLRYRWRDRAFHQAPFNGDIGSRDAMIHTAGVRQHFDLAEGRYSLFGGYAYEAHAAANSDPAAEAFSYDGHQFEAGLWMGMAKDHEVTLEFRYRDEDYASESAQFAQDDKGVLSGQKRKDEEYRAIIALRKEVTERFAVILSYLYVDNESTDAQFDYVRHIGSLSVEVEL